MRSIVLAGPGPRSCQCAASLLPGETAGAHRGHRTKGDQMTKAIAVSTLLALLASPARAQVTFGAAVFTAPSEWRMVQSPGEVSLENPRSAEGRVCRVRISATEPVSVITAKAYVTYRSRLGDAGVEYSADDAQIRRSDADGIVTFA